MRILKYVVAGAVGLVLLLATTGTLLLVTDMGRERALRIAVPKLRGLVHGRVRVDRLEGNLLGDFSLVGLAITDSAGLPFVEADCLSARLAVWSLFSNRIVVTRATLTRPRLHLEQGANGQWNYERLFPRSVPGTGGESQLSIR